MESMLAREAKALHEGVQVYFSVSGCTAEKHIFANVCDAFPEGYQLVGSPFVADIVVVYLCALSDEEIMSTAETMALLKLVKQQNPSCKIIAGGCISEIVNIKQLYPFVDFTYGRKPAVEEILRLVKEDAAPMNRFVPLIRHGVGMVEISNGCMRNCSFCKKAYLPMEFKSKPMDLIMDEVKQTLEKGSSFIYLVCENSTEYGVDIYGERKIKLLLQEILANNPSIKGLFLAGLVVDEIDRELLDYLVNEPKILQLQVEIQSLDNSVRSAMNLKPNPKWTIKVIETLKNRSLLTNVMIGHPGETEDGFRQQLKTIRRNNLWFIQVNKFINTYGTPSFEMEQIPADVVEKRLQKTAEVVFGLRKNEARKLIEESKTDPIQAIVERISEKGIILMAIGVLVAIIVDPKKCTRELKPGEIVNVRLNELFKLAIGGYQIMMMKGEIV